jgi:hypothetical protein
MIHRGDTCARARDRASLSASGSPDESASTCVHGRVARSVHLLLSSHTYCTVPEPIRIASLAASFGRLDLLRPAAAE